MGIHRTRNTFPDVTFMYELHINKKTGLSYYQYAPGVVKYLQLINLCVMSVSKRYTCITVNIRYVHACTHYILIPYFTFVLCMHCSHVYYL